MACDVPASGYRMDRYRVDVAAPEHPVCAGVESFDVDDELYLCPVFEERVTPLLTTPAAIGADAMIDTYREVRYGERVTAAPQTSEPIARLGETARPEQDRLPAARPRAEHDAAPAVPAGARQRLRLGCGQRAQALTSRAASSCTALRSLLPGSLLSGPSTRRIVWTEISRSTSVRAVSVSTARRAADGRPRPSPPR